MSPNQPPTARTTLSCHSFHVGSPSAANCTRPAAIRGRPRRRGRRCAPAAGRAADRIPRRAAHAAPSSTMRTPIGPVAWRRELVTSSLTSSTATSVAPFSPQSSSTRRTMVRAVRTAPGSAGKLHSAIGEPVALPRLRPLLEPGSGTPAAALSLTPITSQPDGIPSAGIPVGLPDVKGSIWTYPVSSPEYRLQRCTVAQMAHMGTREPGTPGGRSCVRGGGAGARGA